MKPTAARQAGPCKRRASIRLPALAFVIALLWAAPAPCLAQNLYVSSQFSSTVARYNAATGAVIDPSFLPGLLQPQNLALSGGDLYVTNLINSSYWTVGKYNAATGAAINASLIAGINPPQGLAASPSALYISSTNTVAEYNAANGAPINLSFISLRVPAGLAVSGNNLYVLYISGTSVAGTVHSASYVSEYNAATGAAINPTLVTDIVQPKCLAVSGNTLYVGSAFSKTVGAYDATTGAAINPSFITSLNPPQGLAVLGRHLYVLYLSGTYGGSYVGEYDAVTGAAINPELITGLVQPTGIVVSPPVPVISTPPGSATGTEGAEFRYKIDASNGPTSFSATGLPRGLTIDRSSGLISGRPEVSGTFAPVISASNAGGTDSEPLGLTILPAPPAITSALKVVSTYGMPFNYRITARNNPTGFGAAGLPAGLSVDTSTGWISGTAAVSGTFAVSISALNTGGTGSAVLAFTVDFNGIKGAYAGLAATGGANSGLFTLSLTPSGGFTGRLTLGDTRYSLAGAFSSGGSYSGTLAAGAATLNVNLTIDPSVPGISGLITVTSAGETTSYTVEATLLGMRAGSLPPGIAGRYTAIIPPASGTDPTLPHAPGFGTMIVTTTGAVRIAGQLGDGTPFTLGGRLHADGKTCTFFSPVYGKTNPGSLAGDITFETAADSDWDGALEWIKPAQPAGAWYPAGFAIDVDLLAAKYSPPALAPGPATFSLGGGDLPASAIGASLAISSKEIVTATEMNSAAVTLSLTPRTGAFSGTFLYPGTNNKTPFSGVIYQKPSPEGFGLFLGPSQSGGVDITQ